MLSFGGTLRMGNEDYIGLNEMIFANQNVSVVGVLES